MKTAAPDERNRLYTGQSRIATVGAKPHVRPSSAAAT